MVPPSVSRSFRLAPKWRARPGTLGRALRISLGDCVIRLPGWIDRDDREPTSFAGTVVLADGESVPVTIVDASSAGCRVECEGTLPIGAKVRLAVGGKSVAAHVRWALPGSAGLRLAEED